MGPRRGPSGRPSSRRRRVAEGPRGGAVPTSRSRPRSLTGRRCRCGGVQKGLVLGVLQHHVEEESDRVDGQEDQAIAEDLLPCQPRQGSQLQEDINRPVLERDLQRSKEYKEQLPKERLVIVGFHNTFTTLQKLRTRGPSSPRLSRAFSNLSGYRGKSTINNRVIKL